MRLLVIACSVLKNEFMAMAPDGVRFEFLEQGLHRTPGKMCSIIQEKIDAADAAENDNDYIVIGYGLCGNGTPGIRARKTPLVIPRAHDCITYWLGSLERQQQEIDKAPASYYLTKGWIEEAQAPLATFEEYVERYGAGTAEWVMQEAFKNYTRVALIDTGAYDPGQYRAYAQTNADFLKVKYEEIEGSLELFHELMPGRWDNGRFIVIPPGEEITQGMFFSF